MDLCMGCMKEKNGTVTCPHCGLNPQELSGMSPNYLTPGFRLSNRYLVGIPLGQGGFGITYIGYDMVSGDCVAIKEYYPGELCQRTTGDVTVESYVSMTEEYRHGKERFLQEARTLGRFVDHPCIVGVRDCFEANGTAYMVMDYLDGVDLKVYLHRCGDRVSVEDALGILTPVMDALRAVHQEGLIHRDISPDNIFITTDGRVRLIDFGAARQSVGGQKSLSIMLKPGYAPEEQYRTRGNQGPWTDVYALTATLYRMITGMVPPDSLERLREDDLVIPSELPMYIQSAIRSGMAVKAEQRFSSVEMLQQALIQTPGMEKEYHGESQENVQQKSEYIEEGAEAPSVQPSATTRKSLNPKWIWSIVAAAVVALGIFGGIQEVLMEKELERIQNIEIPPPAATNYRQAFQERSEAVSSMPDVTATPIPTTSATAPEESIPPEYAQAVEQATFYGEKLGMSEKAVYEALLHREYAVTFSPKVAQYAIDHIEIDYANNALKVANANKKQGMTEQGIRKLLEEERGFTPDEVEYAMTYMEGS